MRDVRAAGRRGRGRAAAHTIAASGQRRARASRASLRAISRAPAASTSASTSSGSSGREPQRNATQRTAPTLIRVTCHVSPTNNNNTVAARRLGSDFPQGLGSLRSICNVAWGTRALASGAVLGLARDSRPEPPPSPLAPHRPLPPELLIPQTKH